MAYERITRKNHLQITVAAGSYGESFCKKHKISHTATTDRSHEIPQQNLEKYKPAPQIANIPEPKQTQNSITHNGMSFRLQKDGTASLQRYNGSASSVSIPPQVDNHRVICIEAEAFQNCHNLNHVAIPASVTKIGRNAFANCGRKEVVDKDLERAYTARCRRDLEFMFGYGYEYYEGRIMSGEDPVTVSYEFSATVSRGSYAEQYCKSNNIRIAGYW